MKTTCTATVMFRDTQLCITWIPGKYKSETFKRLTDTPHIKIPRALLADTATFQDFLNFLETRCAPRTRVDIDRILKDYRLKYYDPLAMCRKSHGRSPTDSLWILFDDEIYKWEDIALPSRR